MTPAETSASVEHLRAAALWGLTTGACVTPPGAWA